MILMLISAIFPIFSMRRDARRRFAKIASHGVTRLLLTSLSFRSRRRDDWRRFAGVVSCGFPKLMYGTYGIFCFRLDARGWFVFIVSYGVSMPLLSWFGIEVGVATIGVATLGVGFSASCLVEFLGLSSRKMASCVGVATPIVGDLVVG
jgi:hypothetical protein